MNVVGSHFQGFQNKRKSAIVLMLVVLGVVGCHLYEWPPSVNARGQTARVRGSGFRTTQAAAPDALNRLVRQATQAVNARDTDSLKPCLTPNALPAFAWMNEKTTKIWAGEALALPLNLPLARAVSSSAFSSTSTVSNSPDISTYLAVFHAWHTCESDGDHVHKIERTPEGWRIGEEIPETETGGYRVRDHDLNVTINVSRQTATIQDKVRIDVVSPAPMPVCLLRLSDDFHVTALTIDNHPAPFQQVGGIIAFVPPPDNEKTKAKPKEKSFVLSLAYASGRISHDSTDYIDPQEATLDSYWYPHIARLPATATVTVTAPPGWTAIAQGEKRQESRQPNGSLTVTYQNDIPTSYFTVDMGRYAITTRKANGRALSVCLLTPNADLARRSLDLLQRAIAFFEARFTAFPYTHYELVETKAAFNGALEAYSFSTFGHGSLPSLIVHEVAHTWWGGRVPCPYTRSMWDESLATYSASLFGRLNPELAADLEDEVPPPPGRRHNFGNVFDAYTLEEARDTSDARQSAIGYNKGALVLRALEEEIGQAALLRCLKTFATAHPKGEAAEWPEFTSVVNKETGQDYNWFFDQWLRRKGLPRVRLANVAAQRSGDGYNVQGEIVQEGEPYRLRMPLRLTTRQGAAIRQNLEVSGTRTPFRFSSPSAPVRLTLDPDNTLPLATTTEQATIGF